MLIPSGGLHRLFTELASFINSLLLKKSQSLWLSVFAGVMLVLAWPVSPFTFLIFFAWIPILFLAESETKTIRFFWLAYLSLLIWNVGTTWWIWNATAPGGVSAVIGNSFLLSIPLWAFHRIKHKFGDNIGYISFIVFWLTFEYIHLNWQLSWPWLTLGNVFATHTTWVQWYEYTGVSGGSLWVLLSNMLIFLLIKNWKTYTTKTRGNLHHCYIIDAVVAACDFILCNS